MGSQKSIPLSNERIIIGPGTMVIIFAGFKLFNHSMPDDCTLMNINDTDMEIIFYDNTEGFMLQPLDSNAELSYGSIITIQAEIVTFGYSWPLNNPVLAYKKEEDVPAYAPNGGKIILGSGGAIKVLEEIKCFGEGEEGELTVNNTHDSQVELLYNAEQAMFELLTLGEI